MGVKGEEGREREGRKKGDSRHLECMAKKNERTEAKINIESYKAIKCFLRTFLS